jgi:hypothetical protein
MSTRTTHTHGRGMEAMTQNSKEELTGLGARTIRLYKKHNTDGAMVVVQDHMRQRVCASHRCQC